MARAVAHLAFRWSCPKCTLNHVCDIMPETYECPVCDLTYDLEVEPLAD
jgi:rubredoxin